MGSDLAWFEAKFILSHDKGSHAQCSARVPNRDATDSSQDADKGVDTGVVGIPFVVAEALDKRHRLVD